LPSAPTINVVTAPPPEPPAADPFAPAMPAPEPDPSKQALANRANAALSTGPRTPEGKAIVALNRVSHGLRSPVPVVTSSETAAGWEIHRRAVVADLAPSGAMETALSERVALHLWRLGRVADFETDSINDSQAGARSDLWAASVEDPDYNAKVVRPEEAAFLTRAAPYVAREDKLSRATEETSERYLRLKERVDFAEALPKLPGDQEVRSALATQLLNEAKSYLKDDKTYYYEEKYPWTAGSVMIQLERICAKGQWQVGGMLESVLRDWKVDQEESGTNLLAQHREMTDVQAITKVDTATLTRRRGLPGVQQAETVMKYESHLDRSLARTLAQLQGLRAARLAAQGDHDPSRRGRGTGGNPTMFVGLVRRDDRAEMALNGGNGVLEIEDSREGTGR